MMEAPSSSRASCVSPLTVAAVPTGWNAGVSITPCGVLSLPRRPDVGTVFSISNEKLTPPVYQGADLDRRPRYFCQHPNGPQTQYDPETCARLDFLRVRGRKADRRQHQKPDPEQFERASERGQRLRRTVRQVRLEARSYHTLRIDVAI